MKEEKTTRELREALTKKRNADRNSVKITKNRNFDHVGPDPDPKTKVSKKVQDSLPY